MLQSNPKTIHTLKQKIATSRQKLQDLYNAHGATTSEVLAAGIELDELLNRYQQLQNQYLKPRR